MDIKITVGSESVKTTMLTVKEYLSLVSDPDNSIPSLILNKIGKPLPKHLAEQALIKLVALSKRKTIKMKSKCVICEHENKFEISPDNVQVTDGIGLTHRVGSITVNLRYPMMFEDRDVFEMIDRCIVSFEYADQKFVWEKSSEAEKDVLFRGLTFADIQDIASKLQSPHVYAATPIVCVCGNQYPAVVEGSESILESLGVK